MRISNPSMSMMMRLAAAGLLFVVAAQMARADIAPFVGEFLGSADVVSSDGTTTARDMSVEIAETKDGFTVGWTSTTYKSDGRVKEKTYSIDFVPTDRPDVFAAAQKKNVFGHSVQLDPMKGEPFVWARITGDTMTVYSLFVSDDGGYEMQQFDRTLTAEGLHLDFMRVSNGEQQKSASTLLLRQ